MTPSRYIATADWHFGVRPYGFKNREEDIYKAAWGLLDKCKQHDVNIIFNGGDILDVVRPSSKAVVELSKINKSLIENKQTMFVVVGNHDKVKPHWTEAFENHPMYGIKVLDAAFSTLPSGELVAGIGECPKNDILTALDNLTENKTKKLDYVILHSSTLEFVNFAGNKDILSIEDLKPYPVKCFIIGDTHTSEAKESTTGQIFISPGAIENLKIDDNLIREAFIIERYKDEPIMCTPIVIPVDYEKMFFDIEFEEQVETAVKSILEVLHKIEGEDKTLKVFIACSPEFGLINAINTRILNDLKIKYGDKLVVIFRTHTKKKKDANISNLITKDGEFLTDDVTNVMSVAEFAKTTIDGLSALTDEGKTLLNELFNKDIGNTADRISAFLEKED